MQWHLYGRVVDNFGDVGFTWRLAADLASRGARVRLSLDDPSALAWMAPGGAPGVEVVPWREARDERCGSWSADVVVETFGCGLPAGIVHDMAARSAPPVWINVEHLSAEPFVQRSHGLPSPHRVDADRALTQWYFYPGFADATGGLLREATLFDRRATFDGAAWLHAALPSAPQRRSGERLVSLFGYENPALPGLLSHLAAEPTLLLVAPGAAARQTKRLLGPSGRRGELRAVELPLLAQVDYDHLLWACDLNLVRGEDSFVRAQWAGAPFLWQVYPQDDGVHAVKLGAFLEGYLAAAPAGLRAALHTAFAAWNGLAPWGPLPGLSAWQEHCAAWRSKLAAHADLTTALQAFAASKC